MKHQNGFIGVALILLIVIAAIGGIFYYGVMNGNLLKPPAAPTTTQVFDQAINTQNWKAHTHDMLRFQIKYPDDYMIIEETQNSFTLAKDKLGTDALQVINAHSELYSDYKELMLCAETQEPSMICIDQGENWGSPENVIDTSLDGIKAKMYTSVYIRGDAVRVIQTIKEPIIEVRIPQYADTERNNILSRQTDQILSTFKFTD